MMLTVFEMESLLVIIGPTSTADVWKLPCEPDASEPVVSRF